MKRVRVREKRGEVNVTEKTSPYSLDHSVKLHCGVKQSCRSPGVWIRHTDDGETIEGIEAHFQEERRLEDPVVAFHRVYPSSTASTIQALPQTPQERSAMQSCRFPFQQWRPLIDLTRLEDTSQRKRAAEENWILRVGNVQSERRR